MKKEVVKKVLEALPEEGIKWMQEGYNKDRKGFTNGFNSCLEQVKKNLVKLYENL